MKEQTFTPEEYIRRAQIAAMALGLIDALEKGAIDTEIAQKLLFRPGIFEKHKEDAELYRLLNLGEELESVIYNMSAEAVEKSVAEIKEIAYRILSDAPKVKVIRIH